MPDGADVYLDVMGVPPRVGEFATAKSSAARMDTDWGNLPVLGLRDLIELKKTQRLEDYPVISRLVLAFFNQGVGAVADPPPDQLLDWMVEHLFTIESLAEFLTRPPGTWAAYHGRHAGNVRRWREELASASGWSGRTERELTDWMQRRIGELQAQDREYWKPVIRELKRLHHDGQLMPAGQPV